MTVGVTPVLADQLALAEVGERFLRFMRHPGRVPPARHGGPRERRTGRCRGRPSRLGARLRARGGALRAARRRPARCASTPSSRRRDRALDLGRDARGAAAARDRAGCACSWHRIDSHRARFGSWSGGFWLPECAYRPGLEEQLATAGVRAFCVDQTDAGDSLAQLEPRATLAGPIAVPIDWETIELVWEPRLPRRSRLPRLPRADDQRPAAVRDRRRRL